MDKNKKILREIKNKIEQSKTNRPTYNQAIAAIQVAKHHLQHALDELNNIFNRENEFQLNQDIYNIRKTELDNID